MAGNKISALTALSAAPATGDLLALVDISDTSQGAGGKTKKITVLNLFTSPTVTGAITFGTDTNLYRSGANQLKTDDALGIGITPTTTFHVLGSSKFQADSDTTVAFQIQRATATGRAQLAFLKEDTTQVYRVGLTAAGGTSLKFFDNTQDVMNLEQQGHILLTPLKNVKIGGSADRSTTEGTNHLDIFNGTAPVGTLSNGISLYSASGELRVMDAAGNSTLLSPHNRETNEWIFYSKNTVTGQVLRIDMEKMMRQLDKMLGGGFIEEYVE